MPRRKEQWMDDDDSSGDSDDTPLDDPDDPFDPDDPDQAAERELFRNPYGAARGKKRTRDQLKDDATYGVWAEGDQDQQSRAGGSGLGARSSRGGASKGQRKPDYLKGQSFVAAGSGPSSSKQPPPPVDNLSTALALEAPAEDEEDIAMELASSSSASEQSDLGEEFELDQDGQEEQDDDEDLAPVPGLARASPPPELEQAAQPAEDEKASSLSFAPRGLGSRPRGGGGARGGIGSAARAGIGGGRAGMGAGAGAGAGIGARAGLGAAPMFAAATAASSTSTVEKGPGGADSPMTGAATPRAGLGAGGAGIGARPSPALVDALRAQLAGQGAQSPAAESTASPSLSSVSSSRDASPAPPPSAPSAAAAPPRERRSFLPSAPPSSAAKSTKLSKAESLHFASLRSSGSVGLKMLEKMGWSAASGAGLGKEGQGIVTPIGEGQKLRKKGEGIKSGERSKGALADEARRKGVSIDELTASEDAAARAALGEAKATKKHKDAWQSSKPKKDRKPKTEYKTYEEIVAESGGAEYAQQELLVDLSGNALPTQALSSLPAFGAASADPTRLPELRHNLTLLTSTLSSSLRSLAKEGAGVVQRRQYLVAEEERVRKAVEAQEARIRSLEGVMGVVERVREREREALELVLAMEAQGRDEEGATALDGFADDFDELLGGFPGEYDELRLDEVVVGAITPICRRLFQTWDPLSRPSLAVSQFKRFRKHFLIDKHAPAPSADENALDIYGSGDGGAAARKRMGERAMSPYETLMWTVWLPKVRSAINNSWTPSDPAPAVSLFTAWSPVLPSFVRDNILDQLILPKLSSAIADWSPSAFRRRQAPGLHTIVFPWLEHAGEGRMEAVLDEAKRKVRGWLKTGWKAKDGVPQGLDVWKAAFASSDWDTLLLQHVLPALGALLRDQFSVNPRQQDLAPLEAALAWGPLLRGSMLGGLLEQEFFPKWGEALWVWLTGEPNLEQVAEWYKWWKSYFPDDVVALPGVSRGFRKGLDLMNQAMALGEDVKYRLKKPDFRPKHATAAPSPAPKKKPTAPAAATDEISFRTIVEEVAAAANLVFVPTGQVTPQGQALFRVSQGIEGRGGVTVYLEDDVVWIRERTGGGAFEPVSVEAMVSRALGGNKA
ncbi:hypothetical protein JCM1840_006108 [Sporobolomyces johnsonii]